MNLSCRLCCLSNASLCPQRCCRHQVQQHVIKPEPKGMLPAAWPPKLRALPNGLDACAVRVVQEEHCVCACVTQVRNNHENLSLEIPECVLVCVRLCQGPWNTANKV
jgi:hypothetical protein